MKRCLWLLVVASLIVSFVFAACAPAAPAPEKPAATKAAEPQPAATKPAESKPPAEKPAAEKPAAPKPADKPAEAKPATPKPTDKPADAKPAAAKPPIKIGYLAPATGSLAAAGKDMKDGFALYLEQKANQLAGRQIEALVEDTEAKPDVGLTKGKKLVERDNVNMLAGVVSSGVAYALSPYVKAQSIPLLINNAGSDDLTQRQANPFVFRSSYATGQYHHPLGEWAYKKGYRNAALLAADYAPGYDAAGAFARAFTGAGGKIVQELYPALGAPDPSPFITTVKPNVDVLYAFLNGVDSVRFVQRWTEYGMKNKVPLLGGNALTDETVLPEVKDTALGIVSATTWSPSLDTPANKVFLDAFKKKYNRIASFYAEEGYVGGMVIEKALQAVNGNIEDKDAFTKALSQVTIAETPRGPFKFDKYNNPVTNVYITEVKKNGAEYENVVFETYKDVSQFWKWSPEEYMKMPAYGDMKGKWAQ